VGQDKSMMKSQYISIIQIFFRDLLFLGHNIRAIKLRNNYDGLQLNIKNPLNKVRPGVSLVWTFLLATDAAAR